LAGGGGVSEGRAGENGDGEVERVVAKRPPIAVAGVEGSGLAGPVGQHVRKKRRRHPRGVGVRIGQSGEASGGRGDAADPLAVGVPVGGWRAGVQGVQFHFCVDHVTVYRWVQRCTPLLAEAARPCRHAVDDRWGPMRPG
jgi:hypothetical protein